MKALVKTAKGGGSIEVRQAPVPEIPRDDWVLIKVAAAGVCGTDLHIWHDEYPYWPPVILGHEFSGVVAETGAAAKKFKPGDRVVAEPHSKACGVCDLCRRGIVQLCKSKRSPGSGIDGGFAEYVAMPEMLLHRVPDAISDEIAALAEPIAIAVHQVTERTRVECQDFVVVSGAGPIGIICAFVAKSCGAGTVAVTGIDACEYARFPAAKTLGADAVINVQKRDALEAVMDMTGGKGADLVIETSGAASAIAQTIPMAKICGRICAIGIPKQDQTAIPWKMAVYRSVDLVFCMSSGYSAWDKALALMASTKMDLGALITHREPLDNWQPLFADLEAERGIKGLFLPWM